MNRPRFAAVTGDAARAYGGALTRATLCGASTEWMVKLRDRVVAINAGGINAAPGE